MRLETRLSKSPHIGGGSGASLQAQIDLEETNDAKTSLHFEDISMVDIVNCREGYFVALCVLVSLVSFIRVQAVPVLVCALELELW